MKQTASIISTYAGDTSGVCSALFELGGMVVMHDASGCNSTYSTHDEPRWYDQKSLVFISGLTETEAILGDDQKLIQDTVDTAQTLKPAFIALAGSPIPMMTGVDLPAIAREIELQTGIPSFGFNTDGMHNYDVGAGSALAAIAQRFCTADVTPDQTLSVNLLGATPLDYSINGSIESMKTALASQGIAVHSVWAMGDTLDNLKTAGAASVNLVIASSGLPAAKVLAQRFNTPYVVGAPFGSGMLDRVSFAVHRAAATHENQLAFISKAQPKTVIIGEGVTSLSLATQLYLKNQSGATVLCPLSVESEWLFDGCIPATDEDELMPYLKKATTIIADPLYRPICPETAHFVAWPHEAFSGRIARQQIPNLVSDFQTYFSTI